MKEKTIIYTDGSYDAKSKRGGCGVIIIHIDETGYKVIEISKPIKEDSSALTMRNVAGELFGVTNGIIVAYKNGWFNVDIYYDYIGIEKWADEKNPWKTNNTYTRSYKSLIYKFRHDLNVDIKYHKVKAHSGVQLNERVDALAKLACFDQKETIYETSFKFNGDNPDIIDARYYDIVNKLLNN